MTEIKPNKDIEYVEPKVTVFLPPFRRARSLKPRQETFTSEHFEDALDRVSRPVKGKYSHIPYSSEDFIQDKGDELELEDR